METVYIIETTEWFKETEKLEAFACITEARTECRTRTKDRKHWRAKLVNGDEILNRWDNDTLRRTIRLYALPVTGTVSVRTERKRNYRPLKI